MSSSTRFIALVIISLGCLFACVDTKVNQQSNSQKDAQSHVNDTPPYGIWFWRDDDFATERNVSVSREEHSWSAMVDGKAVSVEKVEGKLVFELPNHERFVGQISENKGLEGTWYQPESKYFYSSMATKVLLPLVSNNEWSGDITIQPRPFHLFLDIFKDNDGNPTAVLRNPERNDTLRSSIFSLTKGPSKNGAQIWHLVAKRRRGDIKIPLLYSANDSLQLTYNMVDQPVVLSRAKTDDLDKYYSRSPGEANRKLTSVEQIDDGWEVAQASDVGFDKEILSQLANKLASNDPRDRSPQLLHSLLVSYKGQLVVEEYYYGHDRESVHDTRSMAKVFGSVLVGAAQQKGFDITPAYSPLPAVFASHGKKVPPEKSLITLEHFLTYTSGLDTSEDSNSAGSEDRLWEQRKEDFWLYTARLPVLHPPGKLYAYSSASANMVGAALEQVTSTPVNEFFHEAIAKPLNFSTYHWNLTPNGKSYLGGGVYMRPRDILKIGALYAANGKWQNKQLIPQEWVSLSTTTKINITPQTTGLTEEEFSNNYSADGQGYIWSVKEILAGNNAYRSYTASGNGGQMIIVVPDLELAVVFTGGNYRMFSVWGKWRQQIVGDFIIPALKIE